MEQKFDLCTANFLDREIRNVHIIKPLDPNLGYLTKYKPYRNIDVDVTPEHEEIEKYLKEWAKTLHMKQNFKSPVFKSDGKYWISLKDRRDWDYPKEYQQRCILRSQLGTDEVDCKILLGDVKVKLMNWEFGDRQGFTFKMIFYRFHKILPGPLENSPEPPKIKF